MALIKRCNSQRLTRWFTIVFLLLATLSGSIAETRIVCYYESWAVYRQNDAKFSPDKIDPHLCTHVVYAFSILNDKLLMTTFDEYADLDLGGYSKFAELKKMNPDLKTILSVGGTNFNAKQFSLISESEKLRKDFIDGAIKFLREHNFDGLDIDWQYPGQNDKPQDKNNLVTLVKEIREAIQNEADSTNRPRLLLSITSPSEIERIKRGFDLDKLNSNVDWINILTYDYYSPLEATVNHHSPLYALNLTSENDKNLNANYTIHYYINAGADRDKLVMGIPTYGRSYTLLDPADTAFGSPVDGPGKKGDSTQEKGYLAYYEICQSLSQSSSPSDEKWTIVQYNSEAVGPYAYVEDQWISYDDENIVKKKTQYVFDNKLGGVMFWAINNDDFNGKCSNKTFPLIRAAKSLLVNLGVNLNVTVLN